MPRFEMVGSICQLAIPGFFSVRGGEGPAFRCQDDYTSALDPVTYFVTNCNIYM